MTSYNQNFLATILREPVVKWFTLLNRKVSQFAKIRLLALLIRPQYSYIDIQSMYTFRGSNIES
jgi:hypothetical protein